MIKILDYIVGLWEKCLYKRPS